MIGAEELDEKPEGGGQNEVRGKHKPRDLGRNLIPPQNDENDEVSRGKINLRWMQAGIVHGKIDPPCDRLAVTASVEQASDAADGLAQGHIGSAQIERGGEKQLPPLYKEVRD